jgi:hypothetical protein
MTKFRFMKRESGKSPDFFPTNRSAVKILIASEKFKGKIWEPACGDGAISRYLKKAGYDVKSTDLHDHGYGESGVNFLNQIGQKVDNIVTNPPYGPRGIVQEFIEHSLRCSRHKVVMFLRLVWLGGGRKRRQFLRDYPPARIYMLGRVKMGPKQGSMIDYVWVVWDKSYDGPTETYWK